MLRSVKVYVILALLPALAACGVPRGAAFQSEVLSVADDSDETTPDFAVEPVTRASLATLQNWPVLGDGGYRWISRLKQPATQKIAPGDRLAVTVWNTEENSLLTSPGQRFIELKSVSVSPTGGIFMPYLGEVKVGGLSPERARAAIEERFAGVIPSAQVQIEMMMGRLNTVNLVGGVASPGSFPLPDQDFTVLGLIAQGGGVAQGLKNPQIRLFRGGSVYGTSVDRLFSEPGLDTTLQGGDKIIVEEDERYFLSLGAAETQSLHPFPKDVVTALDAVSIVGGVTDSRANPKGLLILREYPGSALRQDRSGPGQARVVFTLDLTTADGLFSAGKFRLNSGDLVYATQSRVTSVRTIFGLIGNAFSLANQVN